MSLTDRFSFAPDPSVRGPGASAGGLPSRSAAQAADRLDSGLNWREGGGGAPTIITYAFRSDGTPPLKGSTGFERFSQEQIAVAEQALAAWADVANIRFERVRDTGDYSNNATILFGNYTSGDEAAFAVFPGSRSASSAAGDVWINTEVSYNRTPASQPAAKYTLLHEIGHALGLNHPGDYEKGGEPKAEYREDNLFYTAMSYFTDSGRYSQASRQLYPAAPMIDDVVAIQRIYGVNAAIRGGDTVYGFNATAGRDWYAAASNPRGLFFTAVDAGGTDTFDFSGFDELMWVDLREGGYSEVRNSARIGIAYGTVIENFIAGSNSAYVIGNAANNLLVGRSGSVEFFGEGGDDILRGGSSGDILDGGSGNNYLDGGPGEDIVRLPGRIEDYTSRTNAAGEVVVSGLGIVNTLRDVEIIQFGERTGGGAWGYNGERYSLGAFLVRTEARPNVPAPDARHSAHANDFDGNGSADILWVNEAAGLMSTWSVGTSGGAAPRGDQVQRGSYTSHYDKGWLLAETFDYNGDGRSDLLWQHRTGMLSIWEGTATGFRQAAFNDFLPQGFAQAVGDFNGDGRDDIASFHEGQVTTWLSTGTRFDKEAAFNFWTGSYNGITGTGDFDGDQRDEILIRHIGVIKIFTLNGRQFEKVYEDDSVPVQWSIVGIGDITGDGHDDLLWRHGGGALSIWSGSDTGFDKNIYYDDTVGREWWVAQVADYNGDGRSDILWRNRSGALSTWEWAGDGYNKNVFYDDGGGTRGWGIESSLLEGDPTLFYTI